MCGLCGVAGAGANRPETIARVAQMSQALQHRGPDDHGRVALPGMFAEFRRLSIIDLSRGGHQPMQRGPLTLLFNGEIYNHLELRRELEGAGASFIGLSDSEVLLAAYERWGRACLDRLIGMFALAIHDQRDRSVFLARDRFGVKPLYLARIDGKPLADGDGDDVEIAFASEIGALHAAGIGTDPNPAAWSRFLSDGAAERGRETFWRGIERLGAGEMATLVDGRLIRSTWYDLGQRVDGGTDIDQRGEHEVLDELQSLLEEAVALRFRADVPVGINLSGGLDSSMLLALTGRTQGAEVERIHAFTFVTNDERYDELPWVRSMLDSRLGGGHEFEGGNSLAGDNAGEPRHPHHAIVLTAEEVPQLAAAEVRHQCEPTGGMAMLAYAKLFEVAASMGVKVLLDGQGVDESWAGYDYYQRFAPSSAGISASSGAAAALVQGGRSSATRPEALDAEFAALGLAAPASAPDPVSEPGPSSYSSGSAVTARQLFDIRHNKLPRALRYNDRVSMRSSVELREPFLDHRLVELGLRQPIERKIRDGVGKFLLRQLAARWLPDAVGFAPKRPLQTPQREWLRGELRDWAEAQIEAAVETGWLNPREVDRHWKQFVQGDVDHAFFVWQWIDLGLLLGLSPEASS